jgi:hypothetical protein
MPTARRCSTGSQRSSRSETRTDPGLTGQLRLGEFPLPDVSNLVGNTEMMLGIWGKTTKMLSHVSWSGLQLQHPDRNLFPRPEKKSQIMQSDGAQDGRSRR